jgi:hypothetical protein
MPVKKSKSYSLTFITPTINPADSTTYYMHPFNYTLSTVDAFWKCYIPKAGIITNVTLQINPSAALATAEDTTVSLRVNTTDTALGTIKMNAQNNVLSANCSVPVTTADFIQIKLVTPAWVSNPTGVLYCATIIIEMP